MAASTKTWLVGAAIALAVTLFAMQVTMRPAHAGGRYDAMPFVPFSAHDIDRGYLANDDDEIMSDRRVSRYGSDIDAAVSTARGVANRFLGDDAGDMLLDGLDD